ncbi:MAG: tetratricopeptide repeat protein [Candidatus Nealsonbacteria bacterium]|nr:tetratricopeptide repeat protein [Candidatus Nealsonbacteria bacterium]
MERFTKPSQFNKTPESKMRSLIKEKAEQKPFENPAVQSFFNKWFEINSSIKPEIIDRHNWQQRERDKKGILEKTPDGKQTLFIPKDLRLWEMIGLMEVVDRNIFVSKHERQDEEKNQLLALAKTFRNTGIYISQRLDSVDQGKEVARALAEGFYEYGESLLKEKKPKEKIIADKIADNRLSPEEIEQVDRFFAEDHLYVSRRARAEKASQAEPDKKVDQFYEQERRKTLAQFFRIWEQELLRQQETKDRKSSYISQNLKDWQFGISVYSAFLRKIEEATTKKTGQIGQTEEQIEKPKRDFQGAIFHKEGLQKLVSEMRERMKKQGYGGGPISLLEKLRIDLPAKEKKLADVLNISGLKTELEIIRQTGDSIAIGEKEREIIDKIQLAVSSFPYKLEARNPSEIAANQYINCQGVSMLGGGFLSEVGIKYLVSSEPQHSFLVVITSDGKIEYRDMIRRDFNKKITDKMINSKTKDGKPLTVVDIINYAKNPESKSLIFKIKNKKETEPLTVFPPEIGHQIQLLHNTGFALHKLGHYKEAIETFQQIIAIDQGFVFSYYGLGNAFYALGRHKKAIESYRQFITLADKQGKERDDYWIKKAEKTILKLLKLS